MNPQGQAKLWNCEEVGGIVTDQLAALGLDVGGTKILAGYVTGNGEILASKRYEMNGTDQASSLRSIHHALDDFLTLPWEGQPPIGIGIGLVGEVDYRNGIWVQAMNIPISEPVPLAQILRVKHGFPVILDNDVQAATLAELTFDSVKRFRDFIYLNVGTGIAMGIVSDGRLVRGAANYTGEIGHMSIDPAGEYCACGSRGCLENVASGGGMIKQAQALLTQHPESSLHRWADRLDAGVILEQAKQGDPLASQIQESALAALGMALVNVLNLLNPEAVILGGGVLLNGSLVEELASYVTSKSLKAVSRSLTHFEVSRFDAPYAGLIGAAGLVWR